MIGYLKGQVIQVLPQALVVNVGGVGYEVFCPQQILESHGTLASEIELFVSSQTRTDGTFLYGFSNPVEKSLFLQLIKVDSVGPKAALTLLSAAPADELARLIEMGDVAQLVKLPKVGKKTAEHLVVKLKGKLGEIISELESAGFVPPPSGGALDPHSLRKMVRSVRGDAATALLNLGFKPAEVDRALEGVAEATWDEGLESVLREALKHMNK